MVTLVLSGLLLLTSLLPCASGAEVLVLDRFTSGDTVANLTFEGNFTNSSLGIELPRGARIISANMTVRGILSPAGEFSTRDFSTTAIGSKIWALQKEATGIYPLTVNPYNSGWRSIPSAQVANLKSADGQYLHTETPTDPSNPPWEYPVQLYHFVLPVRDAIDYTLSWLGHGSCDANTSYPYWAEVWTYNHDDKVWDRDASYSDSVAGRDDDKWLNGTFTDRIPKISANGSVEVAVVGPHADVDDGNSTSDYGHLYTDYIGIVAKVASGVANYPTDVVLEVGDTDITLSTGELDGIVVVDEGLGLRQALQDQLDALPPSEGNVTIDLAFRVGELTGAKVGVSGLNIVYRVQDPSENSPPVWTGPSHVYSEEDSDWTPVLDLDGAFTDDFDEGALGFAIADVSNTSALEVRIGKGIHNNWTMEVRPSHDFFGQVSVTLIATDRLGAVTMAPALLVDIEPMPDAPVLLAPGKQRVNEREPLTFTIEARDVDLPGDVLTFSDTSELFDVDPSTGVIEWTPTAEHVGDHEWTVTVTDSDGLSDTRPLLIEVINVDDPPVLTTPAHVDAVQDTEFLIQLTADDPDVLHGDALLFSVSSADLAFEIEPSMGYLWFTPRNADVGVHLLTVGVQDASGSMDETTMEVHVNNVNDAPKFALPGSTTFEQGDLVSVNLAVEDIDLDLVLEVPETLTITANGPIWLSPDADGWIDFTAEQSMVGAYVVTYTVTDRGGLTDSIDVRWTILDVNEAPLVTTVVGATVGAHEDERFTLTLEAEDPEGDVLEWSDDSPLFAIDGTTGEIGFTPLQAQVGTHTVTVTVSDGRGGSATVAFQLVVENVNDAPFIITLSPENGSKFKEGKMVTLSVEVSDEDGDELSITWTSGDVNMGTGLTLDTKKLKPGTRVVKVTVSDGEATVEDEVTLVIKKEEESPGFGVVVSLMGIFAGLVLVVVDRRGGGRALGV